MPKPEKRLMLGAGALLLPVPDNGRVAGTADRLKVPDAGEVCNARVVDVVDFDGEPGDGFSGECAEGAALALSIIDDGREVFGVEPSSALRALTRCSISVNFCRSPVSRGAVVDAAGSPTR